VQQKHLQGDLAEKKKALTEAKSAFSKKRETKPSLKWKQWHQLKCSLKNTVFLQLHTMVRSSMGLIAEK
jgi:hypothetical protein